MKQVCSVCDYCTRRRGGLGPGWAEEKAQLHQVYKNIWGLRCHRRGTACGKDGAPGRPLGLEGENGEMGGGGRRSTWGAGAEMPLAQPELLDQDHSCGRAGPPRSELSSRAGEHSPAPSLHPTPPVKHSCGPHSHRAWAPPGAGPAVVRRLLQLLLRSGETPSFPGRIQSHRASPLLEWLPRAALTSSHKTAALK